MELRDVSRGQLREVLDAEELHGASDLAGKNLDGAVDAFAAAGHQTVEVRTADECEFGTKSDRRDDVRAVHNAGVEVNFEILPDLTDNFWKQVERNGCPVELAAAVIRQGDPVDP